MNDYLVRPIDRNEMLARVRTQLRRKRYADALRDNVQASIELAVIDPLTGLTQSPLSRGPSRRRCSTMRGRGRPVSLMSSTSTTSRTSTTTTVTTSATRCWQAFAGRVTNVRRRSTSPAGSAARNSSSSCPIRRSRSPPSRRAGPPAGRGRAVPRRRRPARAHGDGLDRRRRIQRRSQPRCPVQAGRPGPLPLQARRAQSRDGGGRLS